jgi:hypothetical protein
LRREGGALAVSGAVGTIALLVASTQARHGPVSTAVQLIVVTLLLAWLVPRSVRHSIATSEAHSVRQLGSGEPTPLWQLPAIVVALASVAGLVVGWDAALRVTGGCALVGLAQSVVGARIVAMDQLATERRYVRIPGSRILRGTRLGYTDD